MYPLPWLYRLRNCGPSKGKIKVLGILLMELKSRRYAETGGQVSPSNSEYKITGPSEKPCEDQMLLWSRGMKMDWWFNPRKVNNPEDHYFPPQCCLLIGGWTSSWWQGVLIKKWSIGFLRLIIASCLEDALPTMGRKACSLLVHFLEINRSS